MTVGFPPAGGEPVRLIVTLVVAQAASSLYANCEYAQTCKWPMPLLSLTGTEMENGPESPSSRMLPPVMSSNAPVLLNSIADSLPIVVAHGSESWSVFWSHICNLNGYGPRE